jgi:hypothetical protein
MNTPHKLSEAIQYFALPENCQAFLIGTRWKGDAVHCPHCGSPKVTYLAKARVWKCYSSHPKQKFSSKTGTVFEHSILGLDKLLVAVWMAVNCKQKLSSYTLASVLQISQKSAWRLMKCIQTWIGAASSQQPEVLGE